MACQYAPWNRNKGLECGYKTIDKTYWAYITNEDFEQFKKDMDSRAYEKYKHRELAGCPPNMASCASSSRMIYYAARDIKGFEFEKLLPAGGEYGTAHLDGYLSIENYEIFVEAKCHEMFSSPKKDIAKCYVDLYKVIAEKGKFEYIDKGFRCGGEPLECFDLKQLICHFLGIIHNFRDLHEKKILFIYFTHSLSAEEKEYLRKINPQLLAGIESVLTKEAEEMRQIDPKWLFSRIAKIMGAQSISERLEFVHCDTFEKFRELLKS